MTSRKLVVIFYFLLALGQGNFAQSPYSNWTFGNGGGISFNSGAPVSFPGMASASIEACGAISDANGNLLFYSNGTEIRNRLHNLMPNGTGIIGGQSSAQGVLILRLPGSCDLYYVFTTQDHMQPLGAFAYSVVDMNLAGGLGDVIPTQKNVLVSNNIAEKLTAVPHANGMDYWIIVHQLTNNTFNVYPFTAAGLGLPIYQNVGAVQPAGGMIGTIKANHAGTKIAHCVTFFNVLEILNFNNATGTLTFSNNLAGTGADNPLGLSFSSNDQLLYVVDCFAGVGLYQYDMNALPANILVPGSSFGGNYILTGMQEGPDGVIYLPRTANNFLSSVPNPNVLGPGCGFTNNAFTLGPGQTCQSALPNSPAAFNPVPQPVVSFTANPGCPGSPTQFINTSSGANLFTVWQWDFNNDWVTDFTGGPNAAFTYNSPGPQTVNLIASNANWCDPDTFTLSFIIPTCVSGIINTYTPVTALLPCNGITVGSPAGFSVGQKVLIIQMKGATIDLTNTAAFGNITSLGDAGNYEFATISSISGNNIYFQNQLLRTYTPGTGLVQLITVPQYSNMGLSNTLTAAPWNGTTGGVLVFEATQSLTLNSDIVVSGQGFRGGFPSTDYYNGCSTMGYYWPQPSGFAGQKGEGISDPGVAYGAGKGKLANGGGGGNHVNAGGAGGGNYGAGGSGGFQWGGCPSIAIGGDPGLSLTWNAAINKIYLGGGGGGPQQNNSVGTAGAHGGGIVIIETPVINGNGRSILADGYSAVPVGGIDGGGAGGAGGAILISGTSTINGNLTLSVRGGNGSSTAISGFSGGHGPGGGGGGGAIYHNMAALPGNVTTLLAGGLNGTSGGNYGAAPGTSGGILNALVIPESTIPPTLPVVDLGPDTSLCAGSSVVLDAGNPGSTYQWSPSGNTQTITVTSGGLYSVTVTDPNGCQDSDDINININQNPAVNLGPDVTICTGGSTILDAGFPGSTYNWSTSASTQTISVSSSGTFSVTVTDANGCQGSDAINVTIGTSLTVNLGPDVSLCDGQSLTLNAGNPGAVYQWSPSGNTQTITVNTTGTYSVTVTDPIGCSGTDTVNVVVNPSPVVSLGPDTVICQGQSVTLDAGNPGANYFWNTSANTQTISITAAGNYFVTVTDANGCQAVDNAIVGVVPNPVVNLGPDVSFCAGQSVVLDAGNPGSSYSWMPSGNTQTITVTTPGTYSVTVINSNGCQGSDAVNVVLQPDPVVSLGPDASICQGNSLLLDAGNPGSTYQWSPSGNSQQVNATSPGVWSVTVTSPFGCTGSDEVMITVNPLPAVDLGPDAILCEGNTVVLDAGHPGSVFQWNPAGNQQTFSATTGGVYSVTVTDANGCSGEDEIVLTGMQLPVFSLGPDTSVCGEDFYLLSAAVPALSWLWSDGSTANELQATGSGVYWVQVTNECGTVSDTVSIELNPGMRGPFIANSFTPNGDGINDEWEIKGTSMDNYSLSIFDRWGKLLFTTRNPQETWNGTFNGQALPEGVYAWVMEVTDCRGILKKIGGTVNLLR